MQVVALKLSIRNQTNREDFNFLGLHPVASVSMTYFRGAVNRNKFYFLILLSTSLHVQVKYLQSFLEAIRPTMDKFYFIFI